MARCDAPQHDTPACLSGCGDPAGRTGVSEGAAGLSQGPGSYGQRPPSRRRLRSARRSVGRRVGGEAPGGEEEARVSVTGRLRVVGSGWITRWGRGGVWVIVQRTTGLGNNGIVIARRHAYSESYYGEARLPFTPGLLSHYLGWHPALPLHKPIGWTSSLRAWASISLSVECRQLKSLLR